MDQNPKKSRQTEEEWSGPWWKHPYMVYLFSVIVLFVFLGLMGYLAVENEWIPHR